jgi:hypothetical protein
MVITCADTKDYPYINSQVAATHELVAEVVDLTHKLGQEIASAEETRKILGIGE